MLFASNIASNSIPPRCLLVGCWWWEKKKRKKKSEAQLVNRPAADNKKTLFNFYWLIILLSNDRRSRKAKNYSVNFLELQLNCGWNPSWLGTAMCDYTWNSSVIASDNANCEIAPDPYLAWVLFFSVTITRVLIGRIARTLRISERHRRRPPHAADTAT